MKKVSIKNMSLLGLVLMAASAVTAAVLPGKSDKKVVNNGTLRQFSAGDGAEAVWSCIDDVDTVDSCTASAAELTTTSVGAAADSAGATIGNTSLTAGQAGDQNSVLA